MARQARGQLAGAGGFSDRVLGVSAAAVVAARPLPQFIAALAVGGIWSDSRKKLCPTSLRRRLLALQRFAEELSHRVGGAPDELRIVVEIEFLADRTQPELTVRHTQTGDELARQRWREGIF